MSENAYEIVASITPEASTRGKRVHVGVELSGNIEAVRSVYISVPQYDVSEKLTNNGSGKFALDYFIPWEAPAGNYKIEIYTIGNTGMREQKTYLDFKVLP